MPGPDAPLSDLFVIDLTTARSGPSAVRQFADWGAQVVRIEPPSDAQWGDLGRRHGADFQNLHRNKRGLTLDLKSPEGRAILLELADRADILVENYRPKVKYRLGIDYATLSARNPRLVYGSISGFGQEGPYADRPGFDQITQGMGGHMMVTGEPGRGPMRSGAAICDMFAGLLCANGIMNALHQRARTGRGQWVCTSLLEAQIFLLDFQAARWTVDGENPGQEGNDHPVIVPMGLYEAQDGYVNIAPMAAMWGKLCRGLGLDHLADHPDFATQNDRRRNKPALTAIINEVTRARSAEHWIQTLNDLGVPCGPVYTIPQTFDDPHVKALRITRQIMAPALGRELTLVGQAIHMSDAGSEVMRPAPEAGEHTEEVLASIGISPERLDDLRARKII